MTLLADTEERSIEASPARRMRAVAAGHGPRAPWLASAIAGLLALALLSAAAAPVALEAQAWLRASMRVDRLPDGHAGEALWPAMIAAATVTVATLVANALAHGGWVRFGGWRRGARPSVMHRAKSALAGWLLAIAALIGGLAGAAPWIGALPDLARRPLAEGAWAVGAFVGSAALGALVATALFGLLQLHAAMRAFDRTLRMTRGEAREAARDEMPAPRRRAAPRLPWRFA